MTITFKTKAQVAKEQAEMKKACDEVTRAYEMETRKVTELGTCVVALGVATAAKTIIDLMSRKKAEKRQNEMVKSLVELTNSVNGLTTLTFDKYCEMAKEKGLFSSMEPQTQYQVPPQYQGEMTPPFQNQGQMQNPNMYATGNVQVVDYTEAENQKGGSKK